MKKFNFKNTTKDVVGSSMMLGVGGMALGAMEGQPGVPAGLTQKTIGTSANMMGAVIPAAYGMGVMQMFTPQKSTKTYRFRPRRFRPRRK